MSATYNAEFAGGYRASMAISADGMWIEWSPTVPQFRGRRLRNFLAAYRQWRHECLADYSRQFGGAVVVVEI